MKTLILIAVIVIVCIVGGKFLSKFKVPKIGAMAMVTGGVKCGKTTLSVCLAMKNYKRALRSVRLHNYFRKLFGADLIEEPLLYSNIPLAVPYVPLTRSLLLRQERFNYGSVILVSEASLVADSQLIGDKVLNQSLLEFNKLIGHETKGGCIIYDTQTIADCHYSIKRCLSEYFYVHHIVKWIPFFMLMYVREDRYSEDGSIISVNDKDVEETLQRVIIPKRIWKVFDRYCYSLMTDDLPVCDGVVKLEKDVPLKLDDIVSFRPRDKKELKN